MANFGVQYQMARPTVTANFTIVNNGTILFDTPLVSADPFISYNTVTGTFTFSRSGNYLVDWFVALKSGLGNLGPTISLVETAPNKAYPATNYMKSGQLNGSALITVAAGTTISLQNQTGDSIVLADNVNIVANISITRVIQELQGVELELTNAPGGSLANNATVAFNTVAFATTNPVISNAAGIITLSVPGVYLFDWNVALNGSGLSPDGIKFQLQNATTNIALGRSSNVVVTPESITGNAILELNDRALQVKLVNTSGNSLTFANISLQATMRVFTLV